MYDSFNRKIHYLRVSVTDRCNLRCRYCMPEEGVKLLHHDDILRFDEIVEVVREAVELGVDKVRITGGEPLVRKGIVQLVEMLSSIEGIKDLSMTTNAILLDRFAQELKNAGLMRVNVSLDTTDPVKYEHLTRLGDIEQVFRGIKAAQKAGLVPIKINCVITESTEEPDARSVARFGKENGLEVRYITQMNLEKGTFSVVEGGEGGDCAACSRLRLTANGKIKPCLFTNLAYNVRELGAKEALLQALKNKPACGSINFHDQFYNIGG